MIVRGGFAETRLKISVRVEAFVLVMVFSFFSSSILVSVASSNHDRLIVLCSTVVYRQGQLPLMVMEIAMSILSSQ